MPLQPSNEIKGLAGAAIGLVTGILVAFAGLMALSMTAGQGAKILAFALMFYLIPFGALAGLLVGAIAGSRGRLKVLVKASGATLAVAIVTVMIVSAWRDEQFEQRLARTVEADGCRNEYRGLTFTSVGGFVSFERLCGQSPHGTMNLSLISYADADSSKLLPKGPGNLLVLEVPQDRERMGFPGRTALGPFREGRQVIRYDYLAHIVSQQANVGDVKFDFVPDTIP